MTAPTPPAQQPKEYKFGYFARNKYKDLVFYVEGGENEFNTPLTSLFELPDTEEHRALMEALSRPHPAPAPFPINVPITIKANGEFDIDLTAHNTVIRAEAARTEREKVLENTIRPIEQEILKSFWLKDSHRNVIQGVFARYIKSLREQQPQEQQP